MAASIELQLLSKLIETGDFRTLSLHRITEDFFVSVECREVFRFIFKHYNHPSTYGSVPSRELLRRRYPAFSFPTAHDDLPTLCSFLRDVRMTGQINTLLHEADALAGNDPREALDLLRSATLSLSHQHELGDNDMLLSDAHDELLQEYQQVVDCGGITGIPFPWQVLNDDTQGMHAGDFILIWGRQKSMKSWIGLYIAMHAYLTGRRRVLIYSLEMPPRQLLRRCAAILAKVPYGKVKRGKLTPSEYERFFGALQTLKSQEGEDGSHCALQITGRGRSRSGIGTLRVKIKDFRADLVIIDGLYLMADDRQNTRNVDWKSMTHISQDTKETAAVENIPIIGITQSNRKGEKDKGSKVAKEADLSQLAFADALGMDSDLSIHVSRQRDKETKDPELLLQFPGTREGMLEAFVINGFPATNFEYKRAVMAEEFQEKDSEPEHVKPGSGKNGRNGHAHPALKGPNYIDIKAGTSPRFTRPDIKTYNGTGRY